MKTYVIHLARRPDRLAFMLDQLGKTEIRYEIVDAVDGRDLELTDSRLFDPVTVKTDTSFDRSCFGAALSHLKVYNRILEEGLDNALILEDDVELPADLHVLLDAITPHMKGAEVVLLNFHLVGKRYNCKVTRSGSISLPSSRLLVKVVEEGSPGSAGAYLITAEACARMVKTVLPVRMQADHWGLFCKEGAIDRLRCVVPMPVKNTISVRTTKETSAPGSLQERVVEAVNYNRIPLLYQALAIRRWWGLRRHWRPGQFEFVKDS